MVGEPAAGSNVLFFILLKEKVFVNFNMKIQLLKILLINKSKNYIKNYKICNLILEKNIGE